MTLDAVEEVFKLYNKWGECNYIGENVTQLQHAQQVYYYTVFYNISRLKYDFRCSRGGV